MSVLLADQPDSVRPAHQAEPNGSDGPPAAASSTNGFHDLPTAPGTDPIRSRQSQRGHGSVPDQQLLNPGPSCRANKGSSSSIPYIDCSDIDSECDVTKSSRAARGHSNDDEPAANANQQALSSAHGGARAGGLFGVVNGFYHTNHQGLGNRNAPSPSPASSTFSASHEPTGDEVSSNGGSFHGRPPLHSTLLDEIFQGRDKRGAAAIVRPLGMGTRSQCASPVIGGFHHRTSSLSHAETANGHGQPRFASHWDDSGHYFSKRPGAVPADAPAPHYGSYSPITANRAPTHFSKLYSNNNHTRNRSDTDPFVLSQLTSTPMRHPEPSRSQAPCSAPTERRTVITNGNHAGHAQRLFGRQGKPANNPANLNQPVQMIDGSTSSGTDTSDTESDTGSSAYSQPLTYGNAAAVGALHAAHSPAPPRGTFSFGSLRLEDEEGARAEVEKGGCYRFDAEDVGARVFSC